MDQQMLEQFMMLSKQIGELTGNVNSLRIEMKEGFKAHDEKFEKIEKHLEEHDQRFEKIEKHLEEHDQKFDVLFKENAEIKNHLDNHNTHFDKIENMIKAEARDTSEMLMDIVRSLAQNDIRVVRFGN